MASAAKVNLPAPATWDPGRQKNSMILVDPEGFNMRYNTVEGTKKYYCLIQEGQDLQLPCLWPRGHGAWQHYGHESLLTLSPTWHTFSLGTQSHLALGLLGTQSHLALGRNITHYKCFFAPMNQYCYDNLKVLNGDMTSLDILFFQRNIPNNLFPPMMWLRQFDIKYLKSAPSLS